MPPPPFGECPSVAEVRPVKCEQVGRMSYIGLMPICDAAGQQIEWLLHGQDGWKKTKRIYDKNLGSISLQDDRFERSTCAIFNSEMLYGESGAHNLFIVDQRTKTELDCFLSPSPRGIGWAIGGQFRGPGHRSEQKMV